MFKIMVMVIMYERVGGVDDGIEAECGIMDEREGGVGDGIGAECGMVPVRDIDSSGQGGGKHKDACKNFGHRFIFFLDFCIIVLTIFCQVVGFK